jgi:signal transduction histidine kinase
MSATGPHERSLSRESAPDARLDAAVRASVQEALAASFERLRSAQRYATAVPIFLTLVLVAIGFFQIGALVSALNWVDHSDQVIAGANEVTSLVVDAETGMRGFLVTGDRAFLEPYRRARATLGPECERLSALVSDNPPQGLRIEDICAKEADWQAYASAAIQLRETGGDYAALAITRTGKERMDAIRYLLAGFIRTEEMLRDERSREVRRATLGTVLVVGGVLVIAAFLLVAFHRRQLESMAATYSRAVEDRSALLLRERAARAQAEAALNTRDMFLSIASHELRTPLAPLMLELQSIERMAERDQGGVAPPRILDKIKRARRQVDHLERLVSDLLDVSRLAEDRLELNLERLDLASVVKEVVERKRSEVERAGCSVRIEERGPAAGSWDRLRIDRVVMNLLDNAIKFGAGKPIEIEVDANEAEATLIVRDHGIGIALRDQERIFQRFERAVSDTNYGGFGLGLWISRQLIEALGGRIGVTSQPNEGATFTIVLPRRRPG